MSNPFPGPMPYRASDRARFFGRADIAVGLAGNVVVNRCVTVYGPSGAGKSSLMQAAVIPTLVEAHGVRAVLVDGWPEGEDPTRWLAGAVYAQLALGEIPADLAPGDAIVQAAQRAARRSPRLLLVCLDQIEQLLYASRPAAAVDAFFEQVQALVDLPIRNARVVLSLREDYLGRFRDRLRDRGRLLANGFRVGPLTVGELCGAVCQAAAAGEPPQEWLPAPTRELMLQVRVPGEAATDEAEAQAAYAQIVCRALFQERERRLEGSFTTEAEVAEKAEPILRRYLDATLDDLGALAPDARRLLEDQLVTADGARTLRTEKELLRILPAEKLGPILAALEGAAILHAEAHQGSRYFEIGHDWLARKVYDQRQEREHAEEERRRAEAQEEALRLERAEARAQRRSLAVIALVAVAVAVGAMVLSAWAWSERKTAEKAKSDANTARQEADHKAVEAHNAAVEASDARLLAGFRELKNSGQLAWATRLLLKVQRPATARGWVGLANDALRAAPPSAKPAPRTGFFHSAFIAPDGEGVVSAYDDRKARLWPVRGGADPVVFEGHKDWVASAALSPDGKRVVTTSFDATARLYRGDGTFERELRGHTGPVRAAAFSPDGGRVVTASDDGTARVWRADGQGDPVVLRGHAGGLTSASWSPDGPDGQRLVTTSRDATARLWHADGSFEPVLAGHAGEVNAASWSPDSRHVVTASEDGTAQVWDAESGAPLVMLEHRSPVLRAIWSPDGKRIATSSLDGKVRVWSADGRGEPVGLEAQAAVIALRFLDGGKQLLGVGADDVTYRWTLDVDTLRAGLAAARATCLPADMRATYLGEPQDEAEKRYATCQAEHPDADPIAVPAGPGEDAVDTVQAPRGPKAPGRSGSLPPSPGAGERLVEVFALPGDAAVEVDGKAARRRDGVVEVVVKAGGETQLKVVAGATGAKVHDKAVTVKEAAAGPVVVDLNVEPPGAGKKGAGKVPPIGFDDQ